MNMLSNLSVSEKRLVSLAVILCIILGGWQFILKPIFKAKSQSESQYSAALRDYEIVQRALPRLTPSTSQSGTQQAFNRGALIEAARSVNIAISRVQPTANGELQVWFDETTSTQVFNFLQTLKGQYGVDIRTAQINRRQDGLVSAQFTFRPISTNKA